MRTLARPRERSGAVWRFLGEVLASSKPQKELTGALMDLVLTVLGCIILKVEHWPYLRELSELVDRQHLQLLRNDLENLVLFESRDLASLLVDLSLRMIRERRHSAAPGELVSLGGSALSRRLDDVVSFLVFRKVARGCWERGGGGGGAGHWPSLAGQLDQLICQRVRQKRLNKIDRCLRTNPRWRKPARASPRAIQVEDGAEGSLAEQRFSTLLRRELSLYEECEDSYWFSGSKEHVCRRIDCPLCSAWMWIPIYYCLSFLLPLLLNLAYTLLYALRICLR